MKMKLNTLRMRFAVWTAGLLFFTLAIFSGFLYVNAYVDRYSALDNSLREIASQVESTVEVHANQIQVGEDFNDLITVPGMTGHLDSGLTIQIQNAQGGNIRTFGPYRTVPLDAKEISLLQGGQTSIETVTDPVNHIRVRFYSMPVIEKGVLVGVVRAAQSLTLVQQALSQLLWILCFGVPILTLIAGFGGYYIAYQAVKPIDQIIQTARSISVEDLSARLNFAKTDDEVGRLETTLNELLDRLDQSFQREHQFIADASHELRTPVTAMQMILSSTLERERSATEYQQAMTDLHKVTGRIQSMIQNLLFLADSPHHKLASISQLDLSVLLGDVVESMQPLAETKGLRLRCTLVNGLVMLGDEDSLIRLFYNLIDNAIKYTPEGGATIQASRGSEGRTLVITISDSGNGIPAEHLPRIFDRFYRVDPSRSAPGSGLGLAIAQEIVRKHHGEISVTSQMGKGTVFSLVFPAVSE
jgi:heavy metal sensor kinase